jgi:DDE superfamily endonuclease
LPTSGRKFSHRGW